MSDTPDPAREVLRDIPPELAIDYALRWREQRDAAITQRDQAASERDALRAEVEKLRASIDTLHSQAAALAKLCGAKASRSDYASGPEHAEAVMKEIAAEVEKLRAAQATAPVASAAQGANAVAHTPGPWIVEDTGTHLWIGPPRSDGSGKVADIVVSMDIARFTPEARARAIANACLIAAAPDLRASRPASLGDKAREVAQACMNAVKIGAKPWSEDNARQYEFARERVFMLAKHLTDADLAPDPVANDGRDVVRAAKRFLLVDEDENASADDCDEARRLLGEALLEYDEDLRAARAKGGAS